jgi:Na+/proline symporter
MAATTVNDFYLKYVRPSASDAAVMRVSRTATIAWGVLQIAIAIAAQRLDRSVLSAGLGILSLTAGPVLGAFLLGAFAPQVGAWPTVAGMTVGMLVLVVVWWTGAAAWTWYALLGAIVTIVCTIVISWLPPSRLRRRLWRGSPKRASRAAAARGRSLAGVRAD